MLSQMPVRRCDLREVDDVDDLAGLGELELARRVAELADEPAARELAVRSYDLIRLRVQRFRHPSSPGVGIPRDDWDDAAQDAWMRAVQALLNLRQPAAFRGVLHSAITNACMDWCRRDLRHDKRRGGSIDETREAADGSSLGAMDAQLGRIAGRSPGIAERVAAADELDRALAALPERQRQVVRLTEQGYVSKEIAELLGESVANVDQLRSRAYRRLRGDLG
jgi:RNA polymerase sigma factor (sigma-70 family)